MRSLLDRSRLRAFGALLAILSALLCAPLPAAEPYFQRLGTEQGLPRKTVLSLAQDAQGFIWIGTQSGLLRYDGYTYRLYRQSAEQGAHSLSDNWIWTILPAADGSLWVGTRTGGLNRLRPDGSVQVFRHDPADANSLSGDEVLALLPANAEQLWVGTRQGLNLLSLDSGRVQRFMRSEGEPRSLSHSTVKALAPAEDGKLWVGTQAGLNLLDPARGVLRVYRPDPDNPHSLPAASISRLLRDARGRLWIGTERGALARYRPEGDDFETLNRASEPPLGDNAITALLDDEQGRLWIGTEKAGLHHLDPATGRQERYGYDPQLSSSIADNRISALLRDRSGMLWIGTMNNGLSLHNLLGGTFSRLSHRPGQPGSLSDRKVLSLGGDGGPVVWAGTVDAGLDRINLDTGEVRNYRHDPKRPDSLSANHIRVVLHDSRGRLWLGTRAGLDRLIDADKGTFRRYRYDARDFGDSVISALFEDRDGALWLGTVAGGLARLDPASGKVERFSHESSRDDSLGAAYVRQILRDRRGRLWVGTLGAGFDLQRGPASFRHFRQSDPAPAKLSNNRIHALLEDRQQALWIGTGAGLNRLQLDSAERDGPTRIQSYGQRQGLEGESIGAIVQTATGQLWLSTTEGITRLDPVSGQARNYTARSGAFSGYFIGSRYQTRDGRILFGGAEGITVFHPASIRDNPVPPTVQLTDVRIGNRSWVDGPEGQSPALSAALAGHGTLALPHHQTGVSFEFAALHFSDPARNRYAYQLEGYDKDWIETDASRRFVSYTNLPAGSYRFRVKAANADGLWEPSGASLTLHIARPPWASPWAYLGYALLAALLLTQLGMSRRRRLRAERQASEALQTSAARLKLALWGSGDGLWDWAPDSGALHLTGLGFLGFSDEELPVRLETLLEKVHSRDRPHLERQIHDHHAGRIPAIEAEFRLRHRDGQWRWLLARGRLSQATGGTHITGTFKDIERSKRAELELHYLASHDALTGLANRAAFHRELRSALERCRQHGERVALLFIDLDNFKRINDALGHPFGDRLLQATAARLRAVVPSEAVLARIGGDEFTVMLPVDDATAAEAVAGQVLSAFSSALKVDYYEMVLSPSLGIALYPDHADSADQLILAADTAMYAAKAAGRHAYQLYNATMNARLLRRIYLENSLHRALERGEFALLYQPKWTLRTASHAEDDRLEGAEVLLRWHSPEHGAIAPEEFIPILEDTGLINEVGEWAMSEACAQFRRWQDAGLAPGRLAINTSVQQLLSGDLAERVARLLAKTGLAADSLELELTESVLMENLERSLLQLQSLHRSGVTLIVDDFGTGYSSFAYVKRLPMAAFKIDRSFIRGLAEDSTDAALCQAMIAMAHALQMRVIAEGIETGAQLKCLRELGCDAAQGYLLGRPLDAPAYERYLRELDQPPA